MKFFSKLLLVILLLALSFIAFYQPVYASDDKKDLPAVDDFVPVEVYPEMTYKAKPVYPEKAEKNKIKGVVYIKSLVDKDGTVVKSLIGKSSGSELLDKAALEAAGKCKFTPARQNDRPVATWVSYSVTFSLDDDKKKDKKE